MNFHSFIALHSIPFLFSNFVPLLFFTISLFVVTYLLLRIRISHLTLNNRIWELKVKQLRVNTKDTVYRLHFYVFYSLMLCLPFVIFNIFPFMFRVSVTSTSLSLWTLWYVILWIFSASFHCHLLPRRRIFNFSFLDRTLFRFLIFALPSTVTLPLPSLSLSFIFSRRFVSSFDSIVR